MGPLVIGVKRRLAAWGIALVVFLGVGTAFAQTTTRAAGTQSGAAGGLGQQAWESVWRTLSSIWQGFFERLPLIIAGLIVVALTWLAARLARKGLRRILERRRVRPSLRELASQFTSLGIWFLGLLIAMMVAVPGLTPTRVLGGLGLLSLAVGLAFKDIFQNFLAGVILLWRFPFEPGDYIECKGLVGRVEEIRIRMTQIRKVTDELVLMPNSMLVENPVEVLTHRPERRITIMTGVAYDVPLPRAVDVITEAVNACETVSKAHDVQVFLHGFGNSSMDIEVAWWSGSTPLEQRRSRGEVVMAIKAALDNAGLEIPFPYRTLTFKHPLSVQAQGMDGFGGGDGTSDMEQAD